MNTPTTPSERTLTLSVSGDLLSTNVGSLRESAAALLSETVDHHPEWNVLRLDLRTANMVDSAGLNFVVTLLKRVRARGSRLQIAYTSPNVNRTFIFTRLDQHIELVKV